MKQGQKFKLPKITGIYTITHISKNKILAEAESTTGGSVSLTKNISSGRWIPSKGNKNMGVVQWL